MAAGAVANLQATREAIRTARAVMDHTSHTILSGGQADAFAHEMGIPPADTASPASIKTAQEW